MPGPRRGPTPLFAAAFSALLLLGVLISAGPGEALAALPLMLLLAALVFRRYPGERLIARLAGRLRRRPRSTSSPAPSRVPARWPPPALAALAASRSLRGPPRALRYSI
jgi:hypothetical protein